MLVFGLLLFIPGCVFGIRWFSEHKFEYIDGVSPVGSELLVVHGVPVPLVAPDVGRGDFLAVNRIYTASFGKRFYFFFRFVDRTVRCFLPTGCGRR